ncbi:MAG: hypothetical protein U9Q81_05455 [Pseudomonadota bacterium]|nr:hypothetical protein [Pseudomonadota bacterium]
MKRAARRVGLFALIGCVAVGGNAVAEQTPSYDEARWDPIHFKPAIESASNEDCLACHAEVLEPSVRAQSPAGVTKSEALAWYQTLDTYQGEQESFHRRHLVTDYAKQVMELKCTTCHQGNDPREETAGSSWNSDLTFIQRKHVDPNICLMCHGRHNAEIMGVPPGDWREAGVAFNYDCLLCHAAIRSNRHNVNFLKPAAIEAAAKEDKDVCFGCHGGRAWYRIVYPYPRHPWPGAGDTVPEWAKERPTESEPRFLVGVAETKQDQPQGEPK